MLLGRAELLEQIERMNSQHNHIQLHGSLAGRLRKKWLTDDSSFLSCCEAPTSDLYTSGDQSAFVLLFGKSSASERSLHEVIE
jgi:hypothetical protein